MENAGFLVHVPFLRCRCCFFFVPCSCSYYYISLLWCSFSQAKIFTTIFVKIRQALHDVQQSSPQWGPERSFGISPGSSVNAKRNFAHPTHPKRKIHLSVLATVCISLFSLVHILFLWKSAYSWQSSWLSVRIFVCAFSFSFSTILRKNRRKEKLYKNSYFLSYFW